MNRRWRIRLLVALTGLFPVWWQQRYRDEFVEMIRSLVVHGRRDTISLSFDILIGAADAHLFGHAMGRPPGRRRAVLVTALCGVSVSAAATLVVAVRIPAVAVLVGTVGGLLTGYVMWLAAHPVRPRVGAVVPVLGVAGVLGTGILAVVRFPGAGADPTHVFSVLFAVLLVAYCVVTVTPPPEMSDDPVAVRWGVGAGLGCAAGWVAIALTRPMTSEGLAHDLWPVGLLPVAAAFGVAVARHSGRSGVQAGVWAGLVATTAFFVTNVLVLLNLRSFPLTDPYDVAAFARSSFHTTAAFLVSDDLGGLILSLVWLPLVLTGLGIVGAVLGTVLRRSVRRRA